MRTSWTSIVIGATERSATPSASYGESPPALALLAPRLDLPHHHVGTGEQEWLGEVVPARATGEVGRLNRVPRGSRRRVRERRSPVVAALEPADLLPAVQTPWASRTALRSSITASPDHAVQSCDRTIGITLLSHKGYATARADRLPTHSGRKDLAAHHDRLGDVVPVDGGEVRVEGVRRPLRPSHPGQPFSWIAVRSRSMYRRCSHSSLSTTRKQEATVRTCSG